MKFKSEAHADRGINVKGPNGEPTVLVVRPGEEHDVELVNKSDPVFYGLVARREFLLDEQRKVPQAPPVAPSEATPVHGPVDGMPPAAHAPVDPVQPPAPPPAPTPVGAAPAPVQPHVATDEEKKAAADADKARAELAKPADAKAGDMKPSDKK